MTQNVMSLDELASAALKDVYDFHAFLAEWYSGRSLAGASTLADQRRRFAPDMQYISPHGDTFDGSDIESMLAGAYGTEPTISIAVHNATVRRAGVGSVLVTYEELQTGGSQDTRRLTTALFVPKPDAPNGVGWFHVHEVWLGAR